MAANLAELSQALAALKAQFDQAQAQVSNLTNALGQANQANIQLLQQIQTDHTNDPASRPRLRKPEPFKGKSPINSWVVHMDNYLTTASPEESLPIAVSYLEGSAHEWWIAYQSTPEGSIVTSWIDLRSALLKRFQPLNKQKAARDKLAKWKQIKDVATFNEDFLRIILDIPNIAMEEQIDRYTRGLKPYIWKELCTRNYTDVSDAMRDAERVEAAHKRLNTKPAVPNRQHKPKADGPVPMDLGNIKLGKLTPAEREQCKKEGRCFRCRQKGHMTKNCPKGRGN